MSLGSQSASGSTRSVAITGLDSSRVVTASYSGNFTVAVNTWKLGGSDAGVVREGSESRQPAFISGSVGIARLSSTRVAVAFVDPSSADLFVYARTTSMRAAYRPTLPPGASRGVADSGIGLLGITPVSSDIAMTAFRDLGGNLKVITFKVTGSSVLPIDTYTAGPVSKVVSSDGRIHSSIRSARLATTARPLRSRWSPWQPKVWVRWRASSSRTTS